MVLDGTVFMIVKPEEADRGLDDIKIKKLVNIVGSVFQQFKS
jgi:hypothetical protein